MDLSDLQTPLRDPRDGAHTLSLPAMSASRRGGRIQRRSVPLLAQAESDEDEKFETAALSALAAIQLEVAEEAARGPTVAAPVLRRGERISGILPVIAIVYTVLAGLAVVGAFVGLLFGLHAAFALPATPARTVVIFEAIGAFVGGLVGALTFFTFRELIHILLDIEENTRPR